MDVTIQINIPVLVGLEKFKTRYREAPSGAWSSYVDRTNTAFTLTGLTDGNYELEVIFVKADGTECPATYREFTVVTPADCAEFTAEIVQNGNLFILQISYTIPSPYVTPPCGYKITYGGTTVSYASLPASPIQIPVPNATIQVVITANGCNGNEVECFNQDIPAIDPVCTPIVVLSDTLVFNNVYPNGFIGMSLTVSFTQSAPASKYITFIVNQINVLSGLPGQASYPNMTYGPLPTGATTAANVPLVMNNAVAGGLYEVSWLIVDGCGVTHTGSASLQL